MTREEAIADIKHAVNWAKENDEKWCDNVEIGSLELAIEALKQPEQKKGKWKGKPIAGYATVRCSVCNDVFLENAGRWNFCPNCGAKMEEEK